MALLRFKMDKTFMSFDVGTEIWREKLRLEEKREDVFKPKWWVVVILCFKCWKVSFEKNRLDDAVAGKLLIKAVEFE